MDKEFYKNDRTLLVLKNCPHCRVWLTFIGTLNAKLPLNKQIDVVEITNYYDYGIFDNPKISAYKKYLTHSYPILFFEGVRLDSNASREELEAFARSLVHEDLQIQEYNKFLFTKNCTFKKIPILGKRLVCE